MPRLEPQPHCFSSTGPLTAGWGGLLRLLACFAISFAAAGSARGQWLVYEMKFTEQPGSINFDFYTGAYLVAPLGGGAASMVFTTENGGNFYAASENCITFFTAANGAERKAVVSALAINGTARAFYTATGLLDTSFDHTANGTVRTAAVAGELAGLLLAADDEGLAADPAGAASVGMAGTATITGSLRGDLSQIVNQECQSMHDSVLLITGLLEKYGYQPDTGEAPAEPPQEQQPAMEEAPQMIEPKDDITGLFGAGGSQPARPQSAVIDASLFPPVRTEDE